MHSTVRTVAIAIGVLVLLGALAAPLLAQRAVEMNEGVPPKIIAPPLYNNQPALSGTYYNPHPIRINNTLFMFAQGGQFGSPDPPGVAFCLGDAVILFETPYTSTGVLASPFSSVSRISPCTTPPGSQPPYHHWAPGNVFVLGDARVDTSARNVGIHSGMCEGASFWKNFLPSIPSGQRTIVKGRPCKCGKSTGATAR